MALSLRLPALRLAHVWVLATLCATLPINTCTPTAVVDLGWSLRSGEWMVANGQVPREDPFTLAPKLPLVVDQQWLGQLALYGLDALGGLAAVIAGTAAAATLAYGGVLWTAWQRTGRLRIACAATLAAYALGFTNLGARTQTLAYPLFALFLGAIEGRRQGHAGVLWWSLPIGMAIWANVHGSFMVGLLLLACAAAGALVEHRRLSSARPYAAMLVLCGLATLATPWGLATYGYLTAIGGHPILRDYVEEWSATRAMTLTGGLFYLSVALLAALAVRAPRALRPADWLVLGCFGVLALGASRGVAWWGLAIAPILATLLATLAPRAAPSPPTREIGPINWLLAAALVGAVAMSLPWTKSMNPFTPPRLRGLVREEMPEGVAAHLAGRDYAGAMFNESSWGGYLEWRLWPRHRPLVDGRIEIYPLEVWQDYLAVTYPTPDWHPTLDRYGVGYLVLSTNSNAELIGVLETSPEWHQDYRDDQAVVFVRSAPLPPSAGR